MKLEAIVSLKTDKAKQLAGRHLVKSFILQGIGWIEASATFPLPKPPGLLNNASLLTAGKVKRPFQLQVVDMRLRRVTDDDPLIIKNYTPCSVMSNKLYI